MSLLSNPDAVLSYCDFDLIDPESRVPRLVVGLRYGDESESIRIDTHAAEMHERWRQRTT
jgi:hypothetical protein